MLQQLEDEGKRAVDGEDGRMLKSITSPDEFIGI